MARLPIDAAALEKITRPPNLLLTLGLTSTAFIALNRYEANVKYDLKKIASLHEKIEFYMARRQDGFSRTLYAPLPAIQVMKLFEQGIKFARQESNYLWVFQFINEDPRFKEK